MEFADKKIVLTGAAGVFGRWIAAHFAGEGAKLCLSDMRAEALEQTVADLSLEPATLRHATELTDQASLDDLVALVRREWGAPDIVINCAGIYRRFGTQIEMEVADWDLVFGVNLRAPFVLTRAFARAMIARGTGGSIINISSGAARRMSVGSVAYCTSKTALERMTKGFALELAPFGIRVNVVEPGFAPGSAVSPLSDAYVAAMLDRIPLGRSSGPQDAPAAIAFLCSERAGFITGAVLSVDGGNSIGTFDRAQIRPPEPNSD
jgi:3-oxoacyl-[acyl-carrier protein] reductase